MFFSLSPAIQSLTWHPYISAPISRRLPMLTPLGRITPGCVRTSSLSDKCRYFAALTPCYTEISVLLKPVLHSVLPEMYTRAMADGYHLVVYPHMTSPFMFYFLRQPFHYSKDYSTMAWVRLKVVGVPLIWCEWFIHATRCSDVTFCQKRRHWVQGQIPRS